MHWLTAQNVKGQSIGFILTTGHLGKSLKSIAFDCIHGGINCKIIQSLRHTKTTFVRILGCKPAFQKIC